MQSGAALLGLQSGIFSFDEDERLMAPYYTGNQLAPGDVAGDEQARQAFKELAFAAACD